MLGLGAKYRKPSILQDQASGSRGPGSQLGHDKDTTHWNVAERMMGRLHWPVDFVYLLKSRNVGAAVQGVGEVGSVA